MLIFLSECLDYGPKPKISKLIDSRTNTELIRSKRDANKIVAKNMAFNEVDDRTYVSFKGPAGTFI